MFFTTHTYETFTHTHLCHCDVFRKRNANSLLGAWHARFTGSSRLSFTQRQKSDPTTKVFGEYLVLARVSPKRIYYLNVGGFLCQLKYCTPHVNSTSQREGKVFRKPWPRTNLRALLSFTPCSEFLSTILFIIRIRCDRRVWLSPHVSLEA